MIILFSKKFRYLFFFLILLFGKLSAQENFIGYINPAISLTLKNESPWSYTFGIAQRNIVYTDLENSSNFKKETKFQGQFLELNHTTSRRIGVHGKFTAGIKYRFIEIFTQKHNETRINEQYSYSKKYEHFSIAHRIRLAQRFRNYTTYRTRYRFSFQVPLAPKEASSNQLDLVTSLEGVWEMGKIETPNFGVRYSNYLKCRIYKNTELNFGLEYRYRNFTQNPYTQLFLISSLKITM
ncbi:DUF2490 domain-containing protein [Mesonia aestuariivivens]|uniref:DUF2490 domain-containing protein n=1 Tax=Mesonia aestuariivivens TaxID=2796128 RepID=A0ABS6VYU7_9FLAO|nr:DUF2490 domain-containing protein [Mesonia aestuariivivens]MBW2960452.1 DUF2490 domain-containing protein [Mesonia aestuariivivens]